jgi:hypothetical protein
LLFLNRKTEKPKNQKESTLSVFSLFFFTCFRLFLHFWIWLRCFAPSNASAREDSARNAAGLPPPLEIGFLSHFF